MVDCISRFDDVGEIFVVDCGSTNPETSKWYATQGVATIKKDTNRGPRAPWDGDHIPDNDGFYVVSDADLDLSGVPADCLTRLRDLMTERPAIHKAGLSLRIDDLPGDSPVAGMAISRETQYWDNPTPGGFLADIDTTFAMYRRGSGWSGYGPAIRLAPPYTARHVSWYLTPDHTPPDWLWYLSHLDRRHATWSTIIKDSKKLDPK